MVKQLFQKIVHVVIVHVGSLVLLARYEMDLWYDMHMTMSFIPFISVSAQMLSLLSV